MPPGQPTKYDPKYCEEIIEYFSVKPYEIAMEEVVSQGRVVQRTTEVASDYPSFAGFAVKIGVHRETLLNWCKANPQFFDAYKKAQSLQENWVLTNGMRSNVNVPFGIFIAKNNLGYKDKQDVEIEQKAPFKFAYDTKDEE